MSVQSDIVTRLSSAVGGRVFPHVMPKGTQLPAVVYSMTSLPGDLVMTGQTPFHPNTRAQVDVWANDYDEAIAKAKQVRALLAGVTFGDVKACSVYNQMEQYEDDTGLYRFMLEVIMDYAET